MKEEYVVNSLKEVVPPGVMELFGVTKKLYKEVKEGTLMNTADKTLKKFKKYNDRLTTKDNYVFLDGYRFIPDESQRRRIVKEAHGLHVGITRTKTRIAELFGWPG